MTSVSRAVRRSGGYDDAGPTVPGTDRTHGYSETASSLSRQILAKYPAQGRGSLCCLSKSTAANPKRGVNPAVHSKLSIKVQ